MHYLTENILFKHLKFNDENVEVDEELFNFLLSYINKNRLLHSISVANLCYLVAKSNNLENPKKYFEIGLLHDIAKDMDKEVAYNLMDKYYKQYIDMPRFSFHQFLAEYILIHDFEIFDNDVLEAVKFHCTGKANMTVYQKIVYACDKIDPRRGYDSKFMIDKMLENYEDGFVLVLKENLKFLKEKTNSDDKLTNFDAYTKSCMAYYL